MLRLARQRQGDILFLLLPKITAALDGECVFKQGQDERQLLWADLWAG